MRVVDIYDRYQDITDVAAFAAATDAVYLKGSDGGAPGPVRADAFAKVMRDTGTPFGLYHYAQFNPSPEQQARVLAAEVNRLGATGLPPALDLEAPFLPNQTARDFAYRFLTELQRLGFDAVTLYANTSMLTGIRAWTLGVPGLRIWAATYGNNDSDFDQDDRDRLARQYPHPVWLYQYSSTGRVPGIPQNTDLNMFMTVDEGDDMSLTQEQADQLKAIFGSLWVTASTPYNSTVYDSLQRIENQLSGVASNVGELRDDEERLTAVVREGTSLTVSAIIAEIQRTHDPEQQVDVERLVALLKETLGDSVAQHLGERLASRPA